MLPVEPHNYGPKAGDGLGYASAGHSSANVSDLDNFLVHQFSTQFNNILWHFEKSSKCVFKDKHILLMIASEVHLGNFICAVIHSYFES